MFASIQSLVDSNSSESRDSTSKPKSTVALSIPSFSMPATAAAAASIMSTTLPFTAPLGPPVFYDPLSLARKLQYIFVLITVIFSMELANLGQDAQTSDVSSL